jgi:serine/threonine protein kinase
MPLSVGDTFSPNCFRSSACPLAHTAAYNRARILHRDVSAGNILITGKGGGILIDWDLSKKVKESPEPKPRLHSRTVGPPSDALSHRQANLVLRSGDMAIHFSGSFA